MKIDAMVTVPTKATSGAAGYDLTTINSCVIQPNIQHLIAIGLLIQLPNGTFRRISPRSGLTPNHDIDVGARVVDSNYRGEIKVLLINNGNTPFEIHPGM
eukprot:1839807-Ditylum_brightwellii.AAC.1